ncbi:Leucine-rich repeat-containing protein 70 [Holothuria leucospilota]|uniref:Leucine-rich repeat-containing protein 70 n=1 Tax=Holothuria leucospilota TaxID=206669 RepID=A0A9Q1CQ81_HOLLE|nr:Leucine-rich repeat-containing protein 70 [Holothuria leucospilota]
MSCNVLLIYIFLFGPVLITSHQRCLRYYDVYDECQNPFPSGCCSLGTGHICNGVALNHSHDFAEEIPRATTALIIANTNNTFINDGDWQFLYNMTNLEELAFFNIKTSSLWDLRSVYFEDLDKLLTLSVAFGYLRVFPVEKFTNLQRLKYLNLRCNKLKSIGQGNWTFARLHSLTLTGNYITAVKAGQLNGLENLSALHLPHNRISYFSLKVLTSLPKLQMLDLSFNRLVYLSDHVQRHVHSIYIFLDSNLLVGLQPTAFHGLESSGAISFNNNSITIPPNVTFEKSVSTLGLSLKYNKIELLSPLFFDNFPHLNFISVAYNRIRYIEEDTFRSVPNLTSITMSHNEIHTIPRQLFQHLQKLDIIELQFNQIQILDPHVLNHLPSHVELFINRNPIVCDCQAIPLLKWYTDSDILPLDYPICQSPESLRNKNIYYANLQRQDCQYSTLFPASSNASPTAHPNQPEFHYVLLHVAALSAMLISFCGLCLCVIRYQSSQVR